MAKAKNNLSFTRDYMKKALIILNPCAGVKKANKFMTDIITLFCESGYTCTVQTTTRELNGYEIVRQLGDGHDLITCIGGDGTYNEVVSGVIDAGLKCQIGYIPAGSTNDFGTSLGLSKVIMTAAKDIVSGRAQKFDVGSFNGRNFTYVASCGAFTDTSYSTPTNLKNSLGHLAYVLQGLSTVLDIKPVHLALTANGEKYEDDYLFVGICNSTSLGGLVKIDEKYVDMNDGLFEVLLVKSPKNIAEWATILHNLNVQKYENSEMLTLFSASEIEIVADEGIDWSLDGERQIGSEKIFIKNIRDAIELIVPNKK